MEGDPEYPLAWEPPTHPGYRFQVGTTDPETGRWLCCAATFRGEEIADHQRVCDQVYAEHAAINQAIRAVVERLPPEFFKPVTDSDGDFVLDDEGQPVMALKDKHQPVVYCSPLGEVTGFTIPGTKHYPAPDAKTQADLAQGMAEALASNELVARLQPLVSYDLVESVALVTADEVAAKEG